jgi:hypothetical protein
MHTIIFHPNSLSKQKPNIILLCSAKTDFKEGDVAPMAHQHVRVFPEWYKPYTFNYTSDGYMLLFFGVIGLFSYSYINDINEQKGRKSRKIWTSQLPTNMEKLHSRRWAVDRIAAGD